jgi:uncharacterized protein
MRFFSSLIPREEKFFDMLDEATAILARASGKFLDMVTQFDRLVERSLDLHEEEHRCDEVVARTLEALDRSFITPFDREDIHSLATSLDDVMDNMEETAQRVAIFRIPKPTPEAVDLARIVRDCCTHLEGAVRGCRTLAQPGEIQKHLEEIRRLENLADKIYRETDNRLFADPPDLLLLIKQRELYGWLEETVDACKDVADVLSEIVIKGT